VEIKKFVGYFLNKFSGRESEKTKTRGGTFLTAAALRRKPEGRISLPIRDLPGPLALDQQRSDATGIASGMGPLFLGRCRYFIG